MSPPTETFKISYLKLFLHREAVGQALSVFDLAHDKKNKLYFTQEKGHLHKKKKMQELCIFAQNMIFFPSPFSQNDLFYPSTVKIFSVHQLFLFFPLFLLLKKNDSYFFQADRKIYTLGYRGIPPPHPRPPLRFMSIIENSTGRPSSQLVLVP